MLSLPARGDTKKTRSFDAQTGLNAGDEPSVSFQRWPLIVSTAQRSAVVPAPDPSRPPVIAQ